MLWHGLGSGNLDLCPLVPTLPGGGALSPLLASLPGIPCPVVTS